MKTKRSEREVQNAICEYLKLRGLFFWRQNTAPTYQKDRQVYRKMPKFARKGVGDILLLHKGLFVCIECKSAVGRQSEPQKEFQEDVEKNGGLYIIARSVDDVIQGVLDAKT